MVVGVELKGFLCMYDHMPSMAWSLDQGFEDRIVSQAVTAALLLLLL